MLAGHSVPNLHAHQNGILRGGQRQFFERAAGHRMERVAYGERKRHPVRDGVMCQEDERCIVPALDEDGAGEWRFARIKPRRQLFADLDLPARARIVILDDSEWNWRALFPAIIGNAARCSLDTNRSAGDADPARGQEPDANPGG
jgi:hypothetical protein